jgi:diguanylate cyclase (GGDEF)-like protein/PAS domain S-box-containing protein
VPNDTDALSQLVQTLERLPALFALSHDAIALYAPDGTVVVGNDAARALVGAAGFELRGSHFSRHVGPGELEDVDRHFLAALSGKTAEFESVFTSRGGDAVDVIARLIPARADGKIVGVFGIARDVAAQRQAEAGRDENRQQFLSLFEQHPDAISMIDAEGRYVKINAATERLIGYRSEEIEGQSVGVLFPPAQRAALERFVLDGIRAGKPARYEQTFPRKDGTSAEVEGTAVPIVVDGGVTGFFLMSRDVTERKRLQEALALRSLRTRQLYRLASEVGANPDEQAGHAIAFGLEEFGFGSAFVVSAGGGSFAIERGAGAELPVAVADPVFEGVCRETLAGNAVLEFDEAALEQRAAESGAGRAFCRSFLGVPLDIESGRYGLLAFVNRSATVPLTDFDREFVRSLAELVAVSIERAEHERRLHGLAHFDELTGLPNRLLLKDRFAQAIATARRRREQLAVYFVDLDKFKEINDTYGHSVGDEVLKIVARRLRKACRESDTVARLAGDEFIVVRPGAAIGAHAEAAAARMREELEAPCEVEGIPLQISACIGISIFPKDGKDQRTLIESADIALYAAKACCGGAIRLYGTSTKAGACPEACVERRARHMATESHDAARSA